MELESEPSLIKSSLLELESETSLDSDKLSSLIISELDWESSIISKSELELKLKSALLSSTTSDESAALTELNPKIIMKRSDNRIKNFLSNFKLTPH